MRATGIYELTIRTLFLRLFPGKALVAMLLRPISATSATRFLSLPSCVLFTQTCGLVAAMCAIALRCNVPTVSAPAMTDLRQFHRLSTKHMQRWKLQEDKHAEALGATPGQWIRWLLWVCFQAFFRVGRGWRLQDLRQAASLTCPPTFWRPSKDSWGRKGGRSRETREKNGTGAILGQAQEGSLQWSELQWWVLKGHTDIMASCRPRRPGLCHVHESPPPSVIALNHLRASRTGIHKPKRWTGHSALTGIKAYPCLGMAMAISYMSYSLNS